MKKCAFLSIVPDLFQEYYDNDIRVVKIKQQIKNLVDKAINEGCTLFSAFFKADSSILFCEYVAECMKTHKIMLEIIRSNTLNLTINFNNVLRRFIKILDYATITTNYENAGYIDEIAALYENANYIIILTSSAEVKNFYKGSSKIHFIDG